MNNIESLYKKNGWAQKIGAQARIQDGEILIDLPYSDLNLNGDGGVVHGGIISTILHDVGKLLAYRAFGEISADKIDTLESQVNFIKGAKEMDLVASASVVRQTKALLFVHSRVKNRQGEDVAVGHFIYRVCNDEQSSDLIAETIKNKFAPGVVALNPLGEMMNFAVQKRHPHLTITAMAEGESIFSLADDANVQDEFGFISRGAELLILDNAGVFASFSLLTEAKKAATVDLKVSFCGRAKDEPVLAYGVSLKHRSNIVNNQIYVLGANSGELISMGTMTFWS